MLSPLSSPVRFPCSSLTTRVRNCSRGPMASSFPLVRCFGFRPLPSSALPVETLGLRPQLLSDIAIPTDNDLDALRSSSSKPATQSWHLSPQTLLGCARRRSYTTPSVRVTWRFPAGGACFQGTLAVGSELAGAAFGNHLNQGVIPLRYAASD